MHFNRQRVVWFSVHFGYTSAVYILNILFEWLCVLVSGKRRKNQQCVVNHLDVRVRSSFGTDNGGNLPCIDVLSFVTILNLLFIVFSLFVSLPHLSLYHSFFRSRSLFLAPSIDHRVYRWCFTLCVCLLSCTNIFFLDSTIFPYLERERKKSNGGHWFNFLMNRFFYFLVKMHVIMQRRIGCRIEQLIF